MSDELDFTYRMPAWKTLLACLFFLGLAGFTGMMASGNDEGMRLFRLITLSPSSATLFLWGLAAVCAAFGAFGLVALVGDVTAEPCRIRLTATEFTAPTDGFRKRSVTVPLSQIRHIDVQSVFPVQFLTVHTAIGKIVISRSDIGADRFERLRAMLAWRMHNLAASAAE